MDFVHEDDRDDLCEVIRELQDGTLRETTSLLIIQGPARSGKDTLINELESLAPKSTRRQYDDFGIQGLTEISRREDVERLNSDIVVLNEIPESDTLKTLRRCHELQRETGKISLFALNCIIPSVGQPRAYAEFDPGVFVFRTCLDVTEHCRKFRQLKRMPRIIRMKRPD